MVYDKLNQILLWMSERGDSIYLNMKQKSYINELEDYRYVYIPITIIPLLKEELYNAEGELTELKDILINVQNQYNLLLGVDDIYHPLVLELKVVHDKDKAEKIKLISISHIDSFITALSTFL